MRVLFLNPVGALGGGERSLLDLARSLAQTAPPIELHLLCGGDGPLAEAAAQAGMCVHRLPMPEQLARQGDSAARSAGATARLSRLIGLARATASLAGYLRRCRRLVGELQPDLIHSNGIKFHLLARWIAGRSPVVWHVRDYVSTRAMVARLLRIVARRPAASIAISRSVRDDLLRILPAASCTVVYNAIDTDHFSPGPAAVDLDAMAGLSPLPAGAACVRMVLVATYARWKGQDSFINAVGRLARTRPDLPIRGYIVGGPIYRTAGSQFSQEELAGLIRAAGVQGQLGLIDFVADPLGVYRAADIVVHASSQPEPFGRTIAEAMACGKAVVVSAGGGAAELIRDGVDAVGFAPGSAEGLAAALALLAADPDRRAQMGKAARLAAAERFSRQRLGPEVREVYQEVLAARPGELRPQAR